MALTLSVVSLSLHSCGKKGVIDEDVMSQIYAEMLMTDQWVNSTPGVRLIADTSLVYEPILKKYGHTSADYRNSVEHYLKDPKEYAAIMTETIAILDLRKEDLKVLKEEKEKEKNRLAFIRKIGKDVSFDKSWDFIDRIKDERCGMIDSVSVSWDSLKHLYVMTFLPWSEKPDTLAARDSIPQIDSLHMPDSLLIPDSLHFRDSLQVLDSISRRGSLSNPSHLHKMLKDRNVADSLIKVKELL